MLTHRSTNYIAISLCIDVHIYKFFRSFNSSGGHPSDKVELTRVDTQGAGLTTSTMH